MQNAKFTEFTKGQFLLKTELRLGLTSAVTVGINGYHTIKDRKLVSANLLGNSAGERPAQGDLPAPLVPNEVALPQVAQMGLGFTPRMRRPTTCSSIGTIYGGKQVFRTATVQASVFGLNRAYLTTEGVPSPSMIERRLKELNVATEIKEARIGRYFNAIMASGFYDNATSVLVSAMIAYYKALFYEKNTYTTYDIVIGYAVANGIKRNDVYETMIELRKYLVDTTKQMGCPEVSEYLLELAGRLSQWVSDSQRAMAALTAQGRQFNESDYVLVMPVQIWEMYTYDDGHSQSGLQFGSHFGFKSNRFLRDPIMVQTSTLDLRVLVAGDYQIPLNDAAVDSVANRKGYLNCSGMTREEIKILNKILSGNKRTSPFLIDQDLDLEIGEQEIYAYHVNPIDAQAGLTYSSSMVKTLINKLVMNHRYYEDLLCAQNYLVNWLAHPATETVEAHWWTGLHRTLSLPKVGLKRAVFPFLMEGEAVCLSADALNAYQKAEAFSETSLCTSLLRNTAWYWGEYLFKINKKNSLELLRSLAYPDDTAIETFNREPVMVSAVLGEKVTVPIYSQTGTYLTTGISVNHKNRVRFGRINIDHMADYGYEERNNSLIFNNIVIPGCAALIVGKSGSLLTNTPYASSFLLCGPERARNNLRFDLSYEFYDLWALGVVNRWQGFDVHYLSTSSNSEHRSFAANNVSIATPPVLPRAEDNQVTFKLQSIRPRTHEFGDPIDNRNGIECKFIWTRSDSYPVEKVDHWAPRCSDYITSHHVVRSFKTVVTDVQHYQVAVFGNYNIDESFFHFDMVRSGIPIPSVKPQLDLREEAPGEPPTISTGEPQLIPAGQE